MKWRTVEPICGFVTRLYFQRGDEVWPTRVHQAVCNVPFELETSDDIERVQVAFSKSENGQLVMHTCPMVKS